MNIFEIEAEIRHDKGKGASRRLRREGKIPAVVYGGHREPVAVQFAHEEMLLHAAHETFYSHILTLRLEGRTERVVLKDMQRHVYKPAILHMDFQRVSESEQLTMRVPIHFLNEDRCVGVKTGGGVISHLVSDLEVTCLPKDLPEYIGVDVEGLNVGESIHLADIKLPDGVHITSLLHGGDPSLAVVSVHLPRAATGAEGEGGEGAPGAEPGEAATGTGA
jgi:large subunit ribosomal protein L25